MEDNTKKQNKKKSQSIFWDWKIDAEDFKNQIENYNSLKITESYRGVAVLIMSGLLAFSLIMGFFGFFGLSTDTTSIIFTIIIYTPILFFTYKGHRWAIILLMILWTLEKSFQLYQLGQNSNGSSIIWMSPIIWWLIIMPNFWKALKVENERIKKQQTKTGAYIQENQKTEEVDNPKSFCSNCGNAVSQSGHFCKFCGNKIN